MRPILRVLQGGGDPDAPQFRPLKGWRLKLEQGIAWILWGPLRRGVDRKFRREWNEGKHRINGDVPWKAKW